MKKLRSESPLTVAKAIIEILNRLTIKEKREFVNALDWEELERLKNESKIRKAGDPEVYIQNDNSHLSLEMPAEKVLDFVRFLSKTLLFEEVEISGHYREEYIELTYQKDKFDDFITTSEGLLLEASLIIEFGESTLISGGGGCLDLTLEKKDHNLAKRIASEFLRICGYKYHFSKDKFVAVVWDKELEVKD